MELFRRKNLFVVNPTSPMAFSFPEDCNLTPAEKDKTRYHISVNTVLISFRK